MVQQGLFRRAPDTDSEERLWLGCPMLSKVTYQPKRSHQQITVLRCALGYALKRPEDVERCLNTPGPQQCWQCQEYLETRLIRDSG